MMRGGLLRSFFFFFNDTATTEIYTLSLHDALPIFHGEEDPVFLSDSADFRDRVDHPNFVVGVHDGDQNRGGLNRQQRNRSEEHTSELQSLAYLVCRLLLEKKKQ